MAGRAAHGNQRLRQSSIAFAYSILYMRRYLQRVTVAARFAIKCRGKNEAVWNLETRSSQAREIQRLSSNQRQLVFFDFVKRNDKRFHFVSHFRGDTARGVVARSE